MRGGGSVVDAFGRGGGARRRARERDAARDRGRAGRAKAGRVTDEGCFLNFCARV